MSIFVQTAFVQNNVYQLRLFCTNIRETTVIRQYRRDLVRKPALEGAFVVQTTFSWLLALKGPANAEGVSAPASTFRALRMRKRTKPCFEQWLLARFKP